MSTQNRSRRFATPSLAFACVGLATLANNPANATITTYEYNTVAGDSGPGAGISYSLAINDATKTFTYTISTNNPDTSPEWYADWFNLKLTPGNPGLPLTVATFPAGTGPWATATTVSNHKVLTGGGNFNFVAQGGFSSIYDTQIDDAGAVNPKTGLLLTGGPATYSFTGTFTGAFDALTTTIVPFQVGYYDGLTGGRNPKFIVNQLSKELDAIPVREPASLAVLGGSLAAVGLFLRRRKHTGTAEPA